MFPIDSTAIILLAGLAFLVEKHHTPRWTIAANAIILINVFGFNAIFGTNFFSLYLLCSIIAAIISIISYVHRTPLQNMYPLLHVLYSSKTVLGLIIASGINYLSYAIIPISAIWFIAIYYFKHNIPFN